MDILKRFQKLIYREHTNKNVTEGNIFQFSGTFYKNNALVIAYDFNRRRLPVLLPCGHTVCEHCLHLQLKGHQSTYICYTCKNFDKKEVVYTSSSWDTDYYALGLIASEKIRNREADNLMLNSALAEITYTTRAAGMSSTQATVVKVNGQPVLCEECSRRPCTCRCLKCQSLYCNVCYTKVHSISKTLRNHKFEKVVQVDESPDSHVSSAPSPTKKCSDHNRLLEYYCELCDKYVCSHCGVLGSCKGHPTITCDERWKASGIKIQTALRSVLVVKDVMTQSKKTLGDMMKEKKSVMSTIRDQIQHHFHEMHSLLQNREATLVNNLADTYNQAIEPLQDMDDSLDAQFHLINSSINKANQLLQEADSDHLALQQTLEQLEKIIETNKCSLKIDDNSTKTTCGSFKVEEALSLCNLMKDYGTVVWTPSLVPTLESLSNMSTEDLNSMEARQSPVNIPKPAQVVASSFDNNSEIGPEFYQTSISHQSSFSCSRQSSDADISSSDNLSDISSLSRASHMILSIPQTDISSKNFQKVRMSHIKSPDKFFIQLYDNHNSYLHKKMKSYTNLHPDYQQLSNIAIGDYVLALYSRDKAWYRAEVIKCQASQVDGRQTEIVEVLFIDYGNAQWLEKSKIRHLPEKFRRLPQSAVCCSLAGIVPVNSTTGWSTEARQAFAKMASDRVLLLFVHSKCENGKYLVDLLEHNQPASEIDTSGSIGEAMVFQEHAVFSSEPARRHTGTHSAQMKSYLTPSKPVKGRKYTALISHVENLNNFYLQLAGGELDHLDSMMKKLQELYTSNVANSWTIICPKKEMPCVAQYNDDRWYRAKVVDLPGEKQVTVIYVDYGNTETISCDRIRALQNSFYMLPQQAHCCSLEVPATMDPTDEFQIIHFIMSLKSAYVKVEEHLEQSSHVLLYDSDGVCINQFLQKPQEDEPEVVTLDHKSVTPASSVASVASKTSKTSKSKKKVVRQTKELTPSPSVAPTVVLESFKKMAYTVAYISHVNNPGDFYLQIKQTQADLRKTNNAMTAQYNTVPPDNRQWHVTESCAVRIEDGTWCRGIVKAVAGNNVKVNMTDYGYDLNTTTKDLRILSVVYGGQPKLCIKCHMDGIIPSAGTKQWSCTSTDLFKDKVDESEMLLSGKGKVVNGSLPVTLVWQEYKQGDALNAGCFLYHSISELLITKGVAFAKENSRNVTPVSTARSISVHEQSASKKFVEPVKQASRDTSMGSDHVKSALPMTSDDESHMSKSSVHSKEHHPSDGIDEGKQQTDDNSLHVDSTMSHSSSSTSLGIAEPKSSIPTPKIPLVSTLISSPSKYETVLTTHDSSEEDCDVDEKHGKSLTYDNTTQNQSASSHSMSDCKRDSIAAHSLNIELDTDQLVANEEQDEDQLVANEEQDEDQFVANEEQDEDQLVANEEQDEDQLVTNEEQDEDQLVTNEEQDGDQLVTNEEQDEDQLVTNEEQDEDQLVTNEEQDGDLISLEDFVEEFIGHQMELDQIDNNTLVSPSQSVQIAIGLEKPAQISMQNPTHAIDLVQELELSEHHSHAGERQSSHGSNKSEQSFVVIDTSPDVECMEQVKVEGIRTNADDQGNKFDEDEIIHRSVSEESLTDSGGFGVPNLRDLFHILCNKQVTSPFTAVQGIQVEDQLAVTITNIDSPLYFHLQYNQVRKENLTPVEKSINNYLGDLLKQSDEIADNGYLYQQLQLDNAHPGTPCLACFSLDNCWYRAFILNIRYGAGGQTVIGVHFVDYGNTEYVTAERLRQIPKNMMNLPAMSIFCHISGLELTNLSKPWNEKNSDDINGVFLNQQCIAVVKKVDRIMELDLYLLCKGKSGQIEQLSVAQYLDEEQMATLFTEDDY